MSQPELPAKVSHAEPIFFDLIRDLGARKGEKELNVGFGMSSFEKYRQHTEFVEYEFAPLNRLGVEIELPFAFHPSVKDSPENESNGPEGIKVACQYSFLVSVRWQTTMAAGYIFESLSHNFHVLRPRGSKHNPFIIVARRFGRQVHSFVYAGPAFETHDGLAAVHTVVNAGVHYVLPETKNFVGLEANGECLRNSVQLMLRPQVKLKLTPRAFLGAAVGIPANSHDNNMDFLFRWIYEPVKKMK